MATSNLEIIVRLINNMSTAESSLNELRNRAGFDCIDTVKNNQVWFIGNDSTYGPRSCTAAVALLNLQHSDVLPNMFAESILIEFNSWFGTVFNTRNLVYLATV